MAKVNVYNLKRERVGEIELADEVFGAEVNEALLYEVVKAQLASRAPARRRRRAAPRSRGSTRSSTSRRAPAARVTARSARQHYVGGGKAHGPQPRS